MQRNSCYLEIEILASYIEQQDFQDKNIETYLFIQEMISQGMDILVDITDFLSGRKYDSAEEKVINNWVDTLNYLSLTLNFYPPCYPDCCHLDKWIEHLKKLLEENKKTYPP